MYEIYDLVVKLFHEPLKFGTIVAVGLFVFDRLAKQYFLRHIRRILHIKNRGELMEHLEKLREIDSKLNALLDERGIEWSNNVQSFKTSSKRGAWRKNALPWLSQATNYAANFAANTTRYSGERGTTVKINKAVLIPLLSAIALFVKQAFDYDIPSHYIDIGADIILFAITAAGVFVHPHKKEERALDNELANTFERSE